MLEHLDSLSINFTMTLTVLTVAVLYLVDTFARQDRSAGRIWAFAFIALLISTLGYLASNVVASGLWAITALGDASFVLFFGALWLGARRFNGRQITWQTGVTIAIAVVESVRERIARKETVVLTLALTIVAVYNFASFIVHSVPALHALPWAQSVFTPLTAAIITIPVAVTAVATTMVLRAGDRLGLGEERPVGELRMDEEGLLTASSLERIAEHIAGRAASNNEQIAVLAMVVTDLPELGSALGSDAQHAFESAWRASWLRHAPTAGIPGAAGDNGLALILHPSTYGEASRVGNRLYGKVVEDLAKLEGAVLPVTGFGFAMSGTVPDDEIIAIARDAAHKSASGESRGQIVSSGDDVLELTVPPRPDQ